MSVTRLAPSPTGALHLGNARTFLVNWLLARQLGWRIIVRIEDLDGPRVRPGAAGQALEDLTWLGLDWDEGPFYQSSRLAKYESCIQELMLAGNAYACVCTRREAEAAASAPHAEDGSNVYPGTCRGRFATVEAARQFAGRSPAIRYAVPERIITFDDGYAGPQAFDVSRQLGDFVIAKADGTPAYQLAVVVDDMEMGVSHIVRGDDLLDSTPRQMLLYEALGRADAIPSYIHLPLVVGEDGRRLAKRHGDSRLATYRGAGVSAARVLTLLGRWCGIEIDVAPASAADLLDRFKIQDLPRRRIVCSPADDDWLRAT